MDAMIAEDLLRNGFVLAQRQAGGAATGEWQAVHLQERDNVLVEGAVVVELIGQVEDDVGLEELEFLPEQIEVVENSEVVLLVAELVESGQDVGFGFAVFGFEVLGEVGVDPRRRERVGRPVYAIGRMTGDRRVLLDGQPMEGRGWDHFA